MWREADNTSGAGFAGRSVRRLTRVRGATTFLVRGLSLDNGLRSSGILIRALFLQGTRASSGRRWEQVGRWEWPRRPRRSHEQKVGSVTHLYI